MEEAIPQGPGAPAHEASCWLGISLRGHLRYLRSPWLVSDESGTRESLPGPRKPPGDGSISLAPPRAPQRSILLMNPRGSFWPAQGDWRISARLLQADVLWNAEPNEPRPSAVPVVSDTFKSFQGGNANLGRFISNSRVETGRRVWA